MIAFGSSITEPDVYRRCAEPGIQRAAEPDSEIRAMPSIGSIFRSYNALLDEFSRPRGPRGARARPPGRGDRRARTSARSSAARWPTPTSGVVGCVGAVGVRSIAWWEASVTCASFINRYDEHGGGDLAVVLVGVERGARVRAGRATSRRSTGSCSCSSPWVVRNIRFDEQLGQFHGYDLDFCLQVREAGLQGQDRRLPRDPPPPARDGARSRATGSRRTSSSPTSGTGGWASAPARGAGATARCGPRRTPTPR